MTGLSHSTEPRALTIREYSLIQTFPQDYNYLSFGNKSYKAAYIMGMSVPPVMCAQLANQIFLQLFN